MLPQERLIERVRAQCARDPRVVSALMYGSFTRGEGDAHSDVEFWLFLAADDLARLDRAAWLGEIAPLLACFENEYGATVAIFEGPVRGEFHFEDADTLDQVRRWRSLEGAASPETMLVLDRTGELAAALADAAARGPRAPDAALAQALLDRALNWLLLGSSVLRRGEEARALDALSHVQRHLLWLARLSEGAFAHWLTPSRALERDLSAAARARFAECSAPLDAAALAAAYAAAWRWCSELARELVRAFGIDPRAHVFEAAAERSRGDT
jgi:lincosamide nucleotidyltransferase